MFLFLWLRVIVLIYLCNKNWLAEMSESHSVVSDSLWLHKLYGPWKYPLQNTGLDSCSLLQGIFSTQGLNPGLPHCRQILYQLHHKGSPRILEWVAHPFSRGESSWSRNPTRSSTLQADSLPMELSGKPLSESWLHLHTVLQWSTSFMCSVPKVCIFRHPHEILWRIPGWGWGVGCVCNISVS